MQRAFEDLKTRITFYEFQPNYGPEPGEGEARTLYSCFAAVDKVWLRDLEQAKANNTLEDLTIVIRDPRGDFIPNTKMYIGIDDGRYYGKRYNVKSIQPDLQDGRFMRVIAKVVT